MWYISLPGSGEFTATWGTYIGPGCQRQIPRLHTLDISAFLSPEPEFESVFISDGNRPSQVLDQVMKFLDGSLLPDSVVGVNSDPHDFDLNTLMKAVSGHCLDNLVLEPRERQKAPSFTLMGNCLTISIPIRSSAIIQGETFSRKFIYSYKIFTYWFVLFGRISMQ